jgi:hypothetical protein
MKTEQVYFGNIKIGACFIWRDREWLKLDNNFAKFGAVGKAFRTSDLVEVITEL